MARLSASSFVGKYDGGPCQFADRVDMVSMAPAAVRRGRPGFFTAVLESISGEYNKSCNHFYLVFLAHIPKCILCNLSA